MNTIFIVLPVLTLLMFELGLMLDVKSFRAVLKSPRALTVGLFGQIVLLPALAFACATIFQLEPYFFIGLLLIACSPGGSSSNTFTMLAKGDLALSVSMTLISSVITLMTLPVIMGMVLWFVNFNEGVSFEMPIAPLVMQNFVIVMAPMAIGVALRRYKDSVASRVRRAISPLTVPMLLILVVLFFVQHRTTIMTHIPSLGVAIASFILLATFCARMLSKRCRLQKPQEKSIVIEVGMQNAAQAIAIASSPFVFNNEIIAIPAIVYALLMNVILLGYLAMQRKQTDGKDVLF